MAAPNHRKDVFQNETGLGGSSKAVSGRHKVPDRFEIAPVIRQAGGI
jgi:hypothetical protein